MANGKAGSGGVGLYDEDFYKSQVDGSYLSATRYVRHLASIFKPDSVADIGCGRGTWLKAFREGGAQRVVGFDGLWNSQEKMVDKAVEFFSVDLNKPIPAQGAKFDLAISLEVAEHLQEASAPAFVKSITELSDVVMFGAAYTGQGGTDHINERPHTYWARMFMAHGYLPYDIFRPEFWGDPDIEFWYQQNTFLYVKQGSGVHEMLKNAGYGPLANISFMDCVHPVLYGKWTQDSVGYLVSRLLRRILPGPALALARRLKKLLG